MEISKLFKKSEEKEYTTFPTTLETYAWYKPILILVIAAIVSLLVSFAALSILRANPRSGGIMGLVFTAITVIAMIPGIYIGSKLVYKIPFSTQVAPVRKWNWGIYIKAFVIALIVYAIIMGINISASGAGIPNNLPIAMLILCLILPIFQGFAEEYLCRGLLMQTFGSWFKMPIIAIILQAAIFAVMHPYHLLSLLSVLCTGIVYGLITWYGQGLEVSSAMHAVNNIFSFLAIGLGIQQGVAGAGINATSFIMNLVILLIPIIIILVLDKFNLIGFEG